MPDAADGPILVCGLGRLGQHCAAALSEFGAPIHAVDIADPARWSVTGLRDRLASLIHGDFRLADTLQQARVQVCRAVLFVASDERANVAGAFAARRLSAGVRVVIRSGQLDLNELLAAHLGNFAAFEPMRLAAPAFALAALGDETVGLFRVHDQLLRMRRHVVGPRSGWAGRSAGEVATTRRRVVGCRSAASAPRAIHEWQPDRIVARGDLVTLVELAEEGARFEQEQPREENGRAERGDEHARRGDRPRWSLADLWRRGSPMQRVVVASVGVIGLLFVVCVLLYDATYPDITLREAVNVASVLVLGGYDNLFGQLHLPFPIPWWLHAYSFVLTAAGTVGTGIVYAFIIERIVAMRLQAPWQRRRLPSSGHVVLVGAGMLARETALLLRRLRCAIVSVGTGGPIEGLDVPHLPGAPRETVARARLASARSVLVTGDDEVANLEVALSARRDAPRTALVLRADDASFSDNVARLVPGLRALGVYGPAAEAFAAAALGEHVHGLSHVDDQTLLVVEYEVEPHDTLVGHLLAEVAYGYGIVPVLLSHAGKPFETFPSDDLRLEPGDRVVAIADIQGLRDVEHGRVRPPTARVRVTSAAAGDASFDGAMTMARVTGCSVTEAQAAMHEMPGRVPRPLYPHQAWRLVRELAKVRVSATVEE